ncbi:hypothetical protein F511_07956 [Dorcoceras hygrometricum]|uniref:Uncharacterized protein n=1 Tax=Dorcoceras hygrometricum TaxID=472368 RepID=A0A2Z7CAV4_9LAMI|nr:hypothetical protein F511_07956 [Dorcoceras hygrometricum]
MADYEKNGSVGQCEETGVEDADPGSPQDSIVKSLEREFSEAARSAVAESSFVEEVEKMALVSDPWAALKNLGGPKDGQIQEPPEEGRSLPASDENVGGSLEATKTPYESQVVASTKRETGDLHEKPKATHGQV